MKTFLVAATALLSVPWLPMQESSKTTYLNDEPVALELVQPVGKEKLASMGPWKLGAKVGESKPHDTRLNLYIVLPGDDYQSESDAAALFDHNRVINIAPKESGSEFDVYWAVALEPHLNRSFRNEADLLAAAQKRFLPGDLFQITDAPAASFMREVLGMDSMDDLKPHRRKDGSLPTLLIIPARFAVRGSVRP